MVEESSLPEKILLRIHNFRLLARHGSHGLNLLVLLGLPTTWLHKGAEYADATVQGRSRKNQEILQPDGWRCQELFHYSHSKRFPAFERVTLRKLLQLHAATAFQLISGRRSQHA
jgi:hypothetical protein